MEGLGPHRGHTEGSGGELGLRKSEWGTWSDAQPADTVHRGTQVLQALAGDICQRSRRGGTWTEEFKALTTWRPAARGCGGGGWSCCRDSQRQFAEEQTHVQSLDRAVWMVCASAATAPPRGPAGVEAAGSAGRSHLPFPWALLPSSGGAGSWGSFCTGVR